MLVISFLVNKPSMWSHIGFQKRGDAPLNMTPTLPSKPTSTSPSPGSVSSVSTHLWIPTEEQKEYYWLYTLGALSTRAGDYFFSHPGGDLGRTWNPACFVLDPFLSLSFSLFFFFFDEQTPLRGTVRARSNQSQPPWDTNASHSDRYAAAYDHLCSFPPVPHVLWERSHSEVSHLSLRHLFQSGPFR